MPEGAAAQINKNNRLTENNFNQAVEYLYRAPVDDRAWLLFFDTLSELLACVGGQFLTLDSAGEIAFSIASLTPEQVAGRPMHSWLCQNLLSLFRNRGNKQLLFQYDFLENPELDKLFYDDTGIRHVTVCRIFGPASTLSIMAWFRKNDQPPMGKVELHWLRRMLPHFERMSRLHVEMLHLRQNLAWREQALDRLDYPILLVTESGRIRFYNRAAELWQAGNEFFRFHDQQLVGRNKDCQVILDRLLLQSAIQQKCAIHAFACRDGKKPYQLMVVPLTHPPSTESRSSHGLCFITVGDPQANIGLTMESLRVMFGFSLAEARVTIGLSEGKTLEEIAMEGGVSINTIRSQLRQALEKTGSCRQVELLRTVTALPRLQRFCKE